MIQLFPLNGKKSERCVNVVALRERGARAQCGRGEGSRAARRERSSARLRDSNAHRCSKTAAPERNCRQTIDRGVYLAWTRHVVRHPARSPVAPRNKENPQHRGRSEPDAGTLSLQNGSPAAHTRACVRHPSGRRAAPERGPSLPQRPPHPPRASGARHPLPQGEGFRASGPLIVSLSISRRPDPGLTLPQSK
jgi:hypothetical protein